MRFLKIAYFSAIFFYLYLPIGVLVINSFNLNRYGMRWDGFTLKWFTSMVQNQSLMEAAQHSLIIATLSAFFATFIGGLGAIGLTRYRFPGRRLIQGTTMTLMMAPDIILAIALLVLFISLGISLGFWSLLLAHITFCLPFTMVTISSRMQGFDPNLLDAARDLGATESVIVGKILLPMIRPALLSSWLLSFTLSLDDVIVSSFVTGPSYDVLPLKIFSMVKVGVKPEVNALATLMVLLSLILVIFSQTLLKEKKTMRNMIKHILVALPILLVAFQALASDKVYVYNWTEYLPEDVLEQFTKETGIEVIYSTYDSNETMYAKLKLIKDDGYDVVFPSTYFVSKMGSEGMLQPLDHSLLPNAKNLDPAVMNKPYDPDNTYSVPYMWGSTGIGLNTGMIEKDTVTSWKDLWRPEFKGQLLLQDDMREVFHMALKIKGYSSNSTDPKEIEEAYLLLKELMPNVLLFNSDSPRLPYLAGEVNVGMIWNGEAWMAQEENPEIAYIYPKEGANFWVDSFVIPKTARNPGSAHAFINFMLRPDIAKVCVEENGYATPVRDALPLLEENVRSSRTIFPPQEIVNQGEFQKDVRDALQIYQQFWEKLRTGQ